MTRDDLYKLIDVLDQHMRDDVPSAEVQSAWRHLRGELRRMRTQSEQAIPRVSTAAQEAIQARNHLQASIEAMTGFAAPPEPPEGDDGP